jgi:uncharacterized protein (TIGR00297 family)
MAEEFDHRHKAIPQDRDEIQSGFLVWAVSTLLILAVIAPAITLKLELPLRPLAFPLLFSAGFALLVWLLRAATASASVMGFLICFILAQPPEIWTHHFAYTSPRPASVASLVGVFVLSFAATKFGRAAKEARGLSESRRGRKASQIVANLGAAGLFVVAGQYVGAIAALAEAAADTVSSEIGQAVGGPTRLLTTLRIVPEGTDGGMSLIGTAAGLAAAAAIIAIGTPGLPLFPGKSIVFVAATAGLFFDSFLGATAERRGWIGNDLVNFASTLVAALIATVFR